MWLKIFNNLSYSPLNLELYISWLCEGFGGTERDVSINGITYKFGRLLEFVGLERALHNKMVHPMVTLIQSPLHIIRNLNYATTKKYYEIIFMLMFYAFHPI